MKTNRNDNYMETRIALLEQALTHVTQTLNRIEHNMEIGFKLTREDNKELRVEGKSQTRWILGFILLILGTPFFSAFVLGITQLFKHTS